MRRWRSVKGAAHHALHSVGIDVIRYRAPFFPNLTRRQLIKARRVSLVIDVGANVGQWASRLRADGYRGRIVSIEPLEDAFAVLESRASGDETWDCVRAAVGTDHHEATIGVSQNSWSSSLRPLEDRHVATAPDAVFVRRESVNVVPLDALIDESGGGKDRFFVKLDVQGYEREALLGATHTLRRAEAVEIELSVVPLYEGQALLPELVHALDAEGLHLVGAHPAFCDDAGDVLQLDAFFVRG